MILTPHTDITATYGGVDADTGMHSYTLRNAQSGAEETVESAYDEGTFKKLMGVDFNTPKGRGFASTLSQTFKNLQHKDQRGFFKRAIAPVLRSVPAYFAGAGPDILALLSYIPGPTELIAMGYEAATGDDPFGMLEAEKQRDILTRKGAEKYGSKAQQLRFQKYLRAADRYAKDNWNFEPFEASVGTDMTPEARGIWEKMVTSGLEFAVSGPVMVKGVTLPAKVLQDGAKYIYSKLAKDSVRELGEDALDPANTRSLIDKANDAYSLLTKRGRRTIGSEATFGAVAGPSVEASLYGLEQADPDAAGWVKMLTAIGSGIVIPLAIRGTWTSLLQGPAIKLLSKAFIDPLVRPGFAASGFVQKNLGGTPEDRASIASTARLLEEAVFQGKHVDSASGLAFTTPELARTRASILREEIEIKRERLLQETNPEARKKLQQEIETDEANVGGLNRTASFYEAVLESAAKDRTPGVASRFFQNETKRLVERREQFFNFIEGKFKTAYDDLSFNGKPGGTLKERNSDYTKAKNEAGYIPEFEATRRKLVMEADPRGVEASELLWLDPQTQKRVDGIQKELSTQMDEAFAKAKQAAEDRVGFWNKSIKSYLAERGLGAVTELSKAEQRLVGDLIRDTYDDAAREWRAFEKAAYRRIDGIEDKVTDNIVFPEGSKDPFNNDTDISGMGVEEWAASRFENLSPTEAFNMKLLPPQLAQLAGSRSIVALMNRRRREGVAASQADNTQARIPDLERRRDDAIAQKNKKQKEYDAQRDSERVRAEKLTRDFEDYLTRVQDKPEFVDQAQAITDFSRNLDIEWANLSAVNARSFAPNKKLEAVFAEIAKQKKAIAELGEGTTLSTEVRQLDKELKLITKEATDAQNDIDNIYRKALGLEEDAVVPETGRLTARDSKGDLVRGGTSANDVKEFVSELADAARIEKAANGKTVKYSNLLKLRETVEQLLNSKTFKNLDFGELNFAREATRLKRTVDDSQDTVLEKTRGSEVKAEVEVLPEIVLPGGASSALTVTQLRKLKESTAELPDFVTTTYIDGKPVVAIDESALAGGASLFERADSPFEMVRVGRAGTPFEIRLKPDFPATNRSLDVAEGIILERLALKFPDGVASKGLESFRKDNKTAIKFLEDNGRAVVPKLLRDADELAIQLDALASFRQDKTRTQLTELVNSGNLDLNGLKIDDYLEYIGSRRKRASQDAAFAEILGADPGRATKSLFERILRSDNNRPKQEIQEFLSLVRGNKQAEKGLQASVMGELFAKTLSTSDTLLKETGDLAFKAFDPVKLRELMSDPRVRTLIQEVFPDNTSLLKNLDDLSKSAFETSNFTQGSGATSLVSPSEAVNLSGWSFLGRVSALGAAKQTGLANELWAAGQGSYLGKALGRKITGAKIKDIIIDGALYPEDGIRLALKTADQESGFFRTVRKAAIDVINVPGAVIKRPAATIPTLLRGEEEFDEPGGVGPSAAVTPQAAPQRRVSGAASFNPQRVPNSALATANPVGPPPAAPPANPLMARGREIFGANDFVFAGDGGYIGGAGSGVGRLQESDGIMSVRRKGRQLVG